MMLFHHAFPLHPFGLPWEDLLFLARILLFDAVGGRGSALLVQLSTHWAVDFLLENRFGFDGLELGLEVFGDVGARVRATTSIVHVVGNIVEFIALASPVQDVVVSEWTLRIFGS